MLSNNKFDFVIYRALAELRSEASRSYLGFIWWLLEPLLYLAAFYLIFALGIRMGGDDYVAFLLIGLISWKWFSGSASQGSVSILAAKNLLQQVYLPKYVLPLVPLIIAAIKHLFAVLLLLVMLIILGYTPTVSWLWLLPITAFQLLLNTSVAMILAVLVPIVPDFRFIISNGLTMLMFLSGIFYDISELDEPIASVLSVNPIAIVIYLNRTALLGGEFSLSFIMTAVTEVLFLMCLAFWLMKRMDRKLPLYLS